MKNNFYVVAIGTSAGGLVILKQIFTQLPGNCNAAFIIIQHLHRNVKSSTDEIISKCTTMPVYRAYENQIVKTNAVYVLPENQTMTVREGKLCLLEREPKQLINRAVNIFFDSMGDDYKERAIGIVLTGLGNDGTEGSNAIHDDGGITMVQTPSTAEFKDMPQSTVSFGSPNFNMPVHELVSTLMELVKTV